MLSLMWTALASPPIQIAIDDPGVKEVYLVCPDRTLTARVYGGKAQFDDHVNGCRVEIRQTIGDLPSPGRYVCSRDTGCVAQGVVHADVSDTAGRVNIIVTDRSADLFELKCGSFRARANVNENTAVFNGVPTGGCTLHYKGAAPARYDGITAGTWQCSAFSGIGKCVRDTSVRVEEVVPTIEEE